MIFQELLIVMPMFISMFWAVLLLLGRNPTITKQYLAFFLSLAAVSYFVQVLFFTGEQGLFAFWDNIWIFTSLAVYPLYYNYIKLVTKDESLHFKRALSLIPALFMTLLSFRLYSLMSPQEMNIYLEEIMHHQTERSEAYSPLLQLQLLKLQIFKVIFVLQVIFTLYFGRKHIVEYNIKIKQFYSSICDKKLSALNQLLYIFLASSVISLISCIAGREYFFERGYLIALPTLLHSISLFSIGFVGFYQDFTIVEFNRDLRTANLIDTEKVTGRLESKSTRKKYLQQLDWLMQEEQLFKNPEVKITDIVIELGSNRTYVSQLINEEKGVNFREWINRYRVEYAKELMMDPEQSHLPMIAIAEMAGFSSRSTFYRVFKNLCGVLPEAFRRRFLDP